MIKTISLIIMTNLACIGIVYGTYRLMAWLDKRRELMALSIEYYKRQNHEIQHTQDDV